MGCDIHMWIEKRTAGGKWECVGKGYGRRNYDAFAILANVRNGIGFAGFETGAGFNPIAMPRGLPPDVSPKVRKESDDADVDGHSHSWLTLAELNACDWQQKTTHCGCVSPVEFVEWREKGKPRSWSASVGGPRVRHISNAEMERRIAAGVESTERTGALGDSTSSDGFYCFTRVSWVETYEESARGFVDWFRATLPAIGAPDDVRIVFFFDN